MSGRYGQRGVDAHLNGDCWPPSCPLCEIEDQMDQDEQS